VPMEVDLQEVVASEHGLYWKLPAVTWPAWKLRSVSQRLRKKKIFASCYNWGGSTKLKCVNS
jgi:hypothetical protein